MYQLFNDQCSHHIETSQLIFRANQLTGFYMMGTLVVKGLNKFRGDVVDVLFIKNKHTKGRHSVATNCFVKELQPKKKTNKSTDNYKRNSGIMNCQNMNWHYELHYELNISSSNDIWPSLDSFLLWTLYNFIL